ncbi:hypothetical protein [Pseudonocardia pini]|uniref:hypothetical protein n=1 Tax=Pseudonocardia pini TaxID=2758030 RepID=UPI0015F047A2|nr:hypothetical protein [Pseudonocardia pini]
MRAGLTHALGTLALLAGYLVVHAVWQWNTAADHYGSIRGQVTTIEVPASPADLVQALQAAPASARAVR